MNEQKQKYREEKEKTNKENPKETKHKIRNDKGTKTMKLA